MAIFLGAISINKFKEGKIYKFYHSTNNIFGKWNIKAGNILAIGGIIGTLAFIIYTMKQRKNDNPKIFYRKKLVNNYNGYIVAPFGVFMKESEKENKALIEHELIHWKQFQREGLIPFLVNYSKEASQKGYDKNPYEKEARTAEDGYCKENYTECVRNGTAKTVYNPNFRS